MSNHIADANKMVSDTPRMNAARNAAMEHMTGDVWRVGCQLERELNAANERIRLLIAERDTARRQADQTYKLRKEFSELLGTDDVERGVAVVREMKERIKRLEEAGDEMYRWITVKRLCSIDCTEAWNKAKEDKP